MEFKLWLEARKRRGDLEYLGYSTEFGIAEFRVRIGDMIYTYRIRDRGIGAKGSAQGLAYQFRKAKWKAFNRLKEINKLDGLGYDKQEVGGQKRLF